MKKIIMLLAVLLLMIPMATAQVNLEANPQQLCELAKASVPQNFKLPSFVPYGDDVLSIHLKETSVGYIKSSTIFGRLLHNWRCLSFCTNKKYRFSFSCTGF